jgi:hypothetical protein
VLAGRAAAALEAAAEGSGTLLCVPLIGQEGLRLGAVVLESRAAKEPFRVDDLRLLTAIALQAAVLVENAARHAELVRGTDELPPPAPSAASLAFSSHTVVTRYAATRCVGPERAGHLGLRSSVDQTAAAKAVSGGCLTRSSPRPTHRTESVVRHLSAESTLAPLGPAAGTAHGTIMSPALRLDRPGCRLVACADASSLSLLTSVHRPVGP